MNYRARSAAIPRHQEINALLSYNELSQREVAQRLGLSERCVSYHANNNCQCRVRKYVYVPASWFKCRLCNGGWFERNGCRHSWELTI